MIHLLADSAELSIQTTWIAAGTVVAALMLCAVVCGAIWVGGKLAGLLEASQQRLEENDNEHKEFRETFMKHEQRLGSLEGWRGGNARGRHDE